MSYATKLDMLARYEEKELIQLSDFIEPYTEQIVDSVLTSALNDASATIDLYIGGRYALPLASVPPSLVDMAAKIAYYNLNRGRYTESIRQDYDDVLRRLEKIASGAIKLFLDNKEPKSAAAIAEVDGPNRVFNSDSLKGY